MQCKNVTYATYRVISFRILFLYLRDIETKGLILNEAFFLPSFRGVKFCWKTIVEFAEPNSVKILLVLLAKLSLFKYHLKDIEIKSWLLGRNIFIVRRILLKILLNHITCDIGFVLLCLYSVKILLNCVCLFLNDECSNNIANDYFPEEASSSQSIILRDPEKNFKFVYIRNTRKVNNS